MVSIFVILGFMALKEAGMNKYHFWTSDWEFTYIVSVAALMNITIFLTLISGLNFLKKNINEFKN
jgi:hypothetical protein